MRTLSSVGFISTAVLTFIYAMLPSLTVLYFVFIAMGVTTILIWWGVRYKLVRLVSKEDEYPKRIGLSYGIYGVAGLLIGLVSTAIVAMVGRTSAWACRSTVLPQRGHPDPRHPVGAFIPKFAGEIKTEGGFSWSSSPRPSVIRSSGSRRSRCSSSTSSTPGSPTPRRT